MFHPLAGSVNPCSAATLLFCKIHRQLLSHVWYKRTPFSEQLQDIVVHQPAEVAGEFIRTHSHVPSCLNGLGLWKIEQVGSFEIDELRPSLVSVDKIFPEPADGKLRITLQRSSKKEENFDDLLPVLSHELSRIDMVHLVNVLQAHREFFVT